MRWDELVFRLFIFWYICGIILLGFDILPWWLEWANAFFLILAGSLGFIFFIKRFGTLTGSLLGIFIFIFTFIVEGAGAKTDFLFGSYDYTDRFAPNVFGVPIAIGFAWLMVMATTHVVARWVVPAGGLLYALVGGVAAVIIDLIIDPVAFQIKEYWIWQDTGWYYEIPWTNFFGWFAVSFVLHLLIDFLMKRTSTQTDILTYEKRMVLLYVLMIGMFILLGMLGGLWMAVIITAILMILITALAWKRRFP
jgi:bisanhydrobacterioruberin hydratase